MSEIFLLAGITLLAAMSPGPDMIIVMKNALYSRLHGYMTATGVGLAILIHVAYCIAGIGFIISQSILLFTVIKMIGAVYLLYISYCLLRSKKSEARKIEKSSEKSKLQAFREGFITNVLNPKATIFFLSVFSQIIEPGTSTMLQGMYGLIMACVAGGWFIVLSTILNISFIKARFHSFQYYMDKVMGGVLALLGLKILLSTK